MSNSTKVPGIDSRTSIGARWHALALSAALAMNASQALGAQTRHEFRELHMGVEVRIVLYASNEKVAKQAARAAFEHVAKLEDILSDYRAESELRRFERRAGEWVKVSEVLFAVVSRALDVARTTDGAFDPTVAPVVALWREARRSKRLPDARALDSARALVDWRRLELDSIERRIRLHRPGMRLDLGGIAKGYIVQRALEVLRSQAVGSALIAAGGDIAVTDAPPGQHGWTVNVADSVVTVTNSVVSTSGARYQYLEVSGVRYSHIVDPRSGRATTTPFEATVIARDGAIADALATALTVLGPERGHDVAALYGATAVIRRR